MLPGPVRLPNRASGQWPAAAAAALGAARSAPGARTVPVPTVVAAAVPTTVIASDAPLTRPSAATYFVPEANPFSSRDHQVEGLYELEGTNYALYEAIKIDDAVRRAEFDSSVHESTVRQLANAGFAASASDVWIQVRPGVIETILIGSVTTQLGSTPVITDAKWPIRVRVVIRCNPHDASRVGRSLSDMARSDLFHQALRYYQSWFQRALGNCSVRMIPPDSEETPVGPVHATQQSNRRVVMRIDETVREEEPYYRRAPPPRIEYRTIEYDEPTLVATTRTRTDDVPQTIYRSATPTRAGPRSVSRRNVAEGDVYSEYRERGSPRTPLPVDQDARYVRVTEPRDRW